MHNTIYAAKKTTTLQYPTPFIVFLESLSPSFIMSAIWLHFKKVFKDGKIHKAQCNKCSKLLEPHTGGLRFHANTHGITVTSGDKIATTQPQSQITQFLKPEKPDSLNALIARLCAKDGIPFSVISDSVDIRKFINQSGLGTAPTSHNTVRICVLAYYNEIKNLFISKLKEEKERVGQFTLSFDEWSSLRNVRYMNLIVHTDKQLWDLGLIRIQGRTNASLSSEDIDSRLKEFQLSLSNFTAMMSDGAPINGAISRVTGLDQQQCLAHGIQLAINSILYDSTENDDNESSDMEDEDELGVLAFGYQEASFNIQPSLRRGMIKDTIFKVRKVVKLFKRSPTMNHLLQGFVQNKLGQPLQLILDTRTRWSSLSAMITRFLKIRDCVQLALVDLSANNQLNEDITFSSYEIDYLESISSALYPIEVLVKSICSKKCSLFDAHLGVEILLDKLSSDNTTLSNDLMTQLIDRLSSRFCQQYYVQLYLEDRKLVERPKYFKSMPNKKSIKTTILSILRRLPVEEEEEVLQPVIESVSIPHEQVQDFKDEFLVNLASKKRKIEHTQSSLETRVTKEMKYYEETGQLGPLISKVLTITRTIRPTTCDCERAFSVAGYFCSKLRSRLGDESLNALVFLKSYFNNHS